MNSVKNCSNQAAQVCEFYCTMANKSQEEPKTAPEPDRWYNLTLGPSFKDESSNKYCTLRCKFQNIKFISSLFLFSGGSVLVFQVTGN